MPESFAQNATLRIAADVGGTFTDLAVFDEATGRIRLGKTLTTPAHLIEGMSTGVAKAGATFSAGQLFLHGTTVAINALLERKGANTALVTTKGFRDIYEIGRVNRPEAYNLFFRKHRPLIERALRIEVDERMDSGGAYCARLTRRSLKRSRRNLNARTSTRSRSCSCTPIAIPSTKSARVNFSPAACRRRS